MLKKILHKNGTNHNYIHITYVLQYTSIKQWNMTMSFLNKETTSRQRETPAIPSSTLFVCKIIMNLMILYSPRLLSVSLNWNEAKNLSTQLFCMTFPCTLYCRKVTFKVIHSNCQGRNTSNEVDHMNIHTPYTGDPRFTMGLRS